MTQLAGSVMLAAGACLIALASHPFLSYPISLQIAVRLRSRPVAGGQAPTRAALCVCAYNEEAVIRSKAENMLRLKQATPGLEVLVYVDAATDRTAEILHDYADAFRVVVAPARHGKTHGMNILVGLTNAECLIFSDANVLFADEAVLRLMAPFADPTVGAVCGHLVYSTDGGATAVIGSAYWRLEERIKRLESASGAVMGADGSIFALRRSLHRPPPPDLIDDMYVSLMVLCENSRIVRAEDAFAYEDSVSRPAEEFRRKVRIACQAFNVHRALWPRLRRLSLFDRYKYVSHKLLRWLVVYFLAAGMAAIACGLALLQAWSMLTLFLGIGMVCASLIATAQDGALMKIRLILEAVLATGIGVAHSMRGKRFQTWTPATSARTAAPVSAS